jgi:Mlc titration factor MtfA (ptsG expression regulator)
VDREMDQGPADKIRGGEAMVFGWLRKRRRSRLLAEPFPAAWESLLERCCTLWGILSETERAKLRDDLRIFMAEVNWEPCGGPEITEEMRVLVAAQACLLTLGHLVDDLLAVKTVLLYPSSYRAPEQTMDEAGIVTEEMDDRQGEAWDAGTVVLSWKDVRNDARRLDGWNLVLHEFAHQIDLLHRLEFRDPPCRGGAAFRRWNAVMRREFTALSALRRDRVLDAYGAEDEAEFFAVATEAFFERPSDLLKVHPELYEALSTYYRQNPAGRR